MDILKKEWDFAQELLTTRHAEFMPGFNQKLVSRVNMSMLRGHIRMFDNTTWGRRTGNGMESEGVVHALREILGYPDSMKYLGPSIAPSGFTKIPAPEDKLAEEIRLAKELAGNGIYLGALTTSVSQRESLVTISPFTKKVLSNELVDWTTVSISEVLKQLWIIKGRPITYGYLFGEEPTSKELGLATLSQKESEADRIFLLATKNPEVARLAKINPGNKDTQRVVSNAIFEEYTTNGGWTSSKAPSTMVIAGRVISHFNQFNETFLKETNVMNNKPFFSTKRLINGLDIDLMASSEIYAAISKQSDHIKNLKAIPAQPQMLKDEIAAEEANLADLIKYLDSKTRTAAAE